MKTSELKHGARINIMQIKLANHDINASEFFQ
jgi:hypothetical protein